MFGKRIDLFRLFGFPVRLDVSWFIVAALIAWSLAAGLFPARYPGLPAGSYWVIGIIGTFALFASIIVHEFSHAMVARREGKPSSSPMIGVDPVGTVGLLGRNTEPAMLPEQ